MLVIGLVAFAAGAELFARFYLGLGDPPLYVTDPEIEYLYAPGQLVHPFGNEFRTNRYGMRSDDFGPVKQGADELRVLVYGDSVINGGSLTSHADLATTILASELRARFHRPVVVGNISAGSWGAPNALAHIRRFGLLQADVVILVLSSDDFADVPTYAALNLATHPTHRPWSAALDGAMRYLPRYFPTATPVEALAPPNPSLQAIGQSLAALRDIVELAIKAHAVPIVIQHWRVSEIARGQPDDGHEEILVTSQRAGAAVFQDGRYLDRKSPDGTATQFRDDIHLNARGQVALAQVLIDAISQTTPAKFN